MSKGAQIKAKIKEKLLTLQRAEVLGEVIVDDLKKGIFDRDFAAYPAAVVTTPAITNDILTNVQNVRTYTFEIVVICKAEDITEEDAIEDLAEQIMDSFDNIPSLEGVAEAGLDPSTSPAEAVVSRGNSWVVFSVILKAKSVKDLAL